MELSFEWLNDDKTLITIHNSKNMNLTNYLNVIILNWKKKSGGIIVCFVQSWFIMALCQRRISFFNRMEMIDLEKEIRQFLLSGRDDFKLFIDEWLYRQWLYSQKEINIITGY